VFPGTSWTVPAGFGYASLSSTNLLFNQFGLDRHGVKGLFLLPIEPKDLLRGKLIGFAGWQGLQAVLLAGLLYLSGHHDLGEIVVGLALYTDVFLVFVLVGTFTSIWQPRPLRQNGLRAANPPVTVMLLTTGTLGITGLVLYGATWLARTWAPGWEVPVLVAIGAVLAMLIVSSQRWLAGYLLRNRERLIETLASVG